MKTRLILTIALAALGLGFIFDASPKEIEGHDLCIELAAVLQDAVDLETISQTDADQIAQRCFNRGGLQ